MSNKFKVAALTAAFALAGSAAPALAQGVSFELWTKEGEADGSLQWVQKLADDYMAANPDVSIEVIQKEVGGSESLRQDFQIQSFAGNPPALLWTVGDHLGPFTAAELLLPLDGLIDAEYVDAPRSPRCRRPTGPPMACPSTSATILMLYYNKDMVAECPADSDALIEAAIANTDADAGVFGMAYRQDESFWLVPFLGGYGGVVFAEDGVTPTLNTEAMVKALTFMNELEFVHGVMPVEADYQIADDLFKQGKAAMTINGDWTLGSTTPSSTSRSASAPSRPWWVAVRPDRIRPATSSWSRIAWPRTRPCRQRSSTSSTSPRTRRTSWCSWPTLKRLPSNAVALTDPSIAEDPLLAGSAEAVQTGTLQPTNLEMRCVFDAMNIGVRANAASADADQAQLAADMQSAAEAGVAPGGECAPE